MISVISNILVLKQVIVSNHRLPAMMKLTTEAGTILKTWTKPSYESTVPEMTPLQPRTQEHAFLKGSASEGIALVVLTGLKSCMRPAFNGT